MSDEELDNVAGGGTRPTRGDNDFLAAMGYSRGTSDFLFRWEENAAAVDSAWSKAGVTSVTKFGCPDNLYSLMENKFHAKTRSDMCSDKEVLTKV